MSVEIDSVSIARTEVVLDGRGARGVNGTLTVSSASGQAVSSRVALAAIASPLNGQPALLTEGGREGLFVFDTSNQLASVTADPGQGIYVAPASAPTGASGAWKRTGVGDILASWFGTVGDGVANDQPPIQQAITYAQGRGGGTVRLGPGTYKCTTGLAWDAAPITLVGEGSSVQPSIGTILQFPAGLSGAVKVRNGAAGLGSNSSVRNLRIKGTGVSGVSDVNALLGIGAGLIIQANGAVVANVVVQGFEGIGCLLLSDSTVTLNANNCYIEALHTYNNLSHGYASQGANSNVTKVVKLDSSNNGGFGIYSNAFLGEHFDAPHLAGNVGAFRTGDISRDCTMIGGYAEANGTVLIQIDAGGGGKHSIEFAHAETIGGATTFTITDNGPTISNIRINSVWRTLRLGALGATGTFTFDETRLLLTNGMVIQLQDDPLTANGFLKVITGLLKLEHGAGPALTIASDSPNLAGAGGKWLTGGYYDTNAGYKVNGVTCLVGQGSAITDAVGAAGAPTQIEFNTLVSKFNQVLANLRGQKLQAP